MQTIKTPRPWKKLISLFAVAATLAGCASSQKYNARLNGKTDFYLTNNVVTSWQWRGNACDAL